MCLCESTCVCERLCVRACASNSLLPATLVSIKLSSQCTLSCPKVCRSESNRKKICLSTQGRLAQQTLTDLCVEFERKLVFPRVSLQDYKPWCIAKHSRVLYCKGLSWVLFSIWDVSPLKQSTTCDAAFVA